MGARVILMQDVEPDGGFSGDSLRVTIAGQLWERVAAPELPDHLWDGGLEPDPSDYRKQQIESEMAWGTDL